MLLVSNSYCQEEQTGIIYGDNHSYSLTSPKGWVLDNSSGVSQGLHAVFYPAGNTWENSVIVMYTNVAHLNSTNQKNIGDVIEYDLNKFRSISEGIKIEKVEDSYFINENKRAVIYNFLDDINGSYESVAYIPEEKIVVLIVISSRDRENFQESNSSFRDLVNSYFWITDNVQYNK